MSLGVKPPEFLSACGEQALLSPGSVPTSTQGCSSGRGWVYFSRIIGGAFSWAVFCFLERCRLSSAGTMLASRFSGIWDREGMLLPETRAMRRCRERAQGVKLQKSYVRGELGLESLVAGFSPSHKVIRVTKGSSPRRAVSIATPACSCEPSDSSNTATPRAGARIVTLAPTRELTFVGREKNKK